MGSSLAPGILSSAFFCVSAFPRSALTLTLQGQQEEQGIDAQVLQTVEPSSTAKINDKRKRRP